MTGWVVRHPASKNACAIYHMPILFQNKRRKKTKWKAAASNSDYFIWKMAIEKQRT